MKVELCPVCNGSGVVLIPTFLELIVSELSYKPCPSCGGKGWVEATSYKETASRVFPRNVSFRFD